MQVNTGEHLMCVNIIVFHQCKNSYSISKIMTIYKVYILHKTSNKTSQLDKLLHVTKRGYTQNKDYTISIVQEAH